MSMMLEVTQVNGSDIDTFNPTSSTTSPTFSSLELELQGSIHQPIFSYEGKIEQCNLGLLINSKSIFLMEQRCKAYLRLRCFRRALEDAETILSWEPAHHNAVYYKIKALFGLDLFEQAVFIIDEYKDVPFPPPSANHDLAQPDLNFDNLLRNAKLYLYQKHTGDYDMAYFLKNHHILYHECADYIGPIELVYVEHKGRGLVATQDIKKGELLIASKALVLKYPEHAIVDEEVHRFTVHETELLRYLYHLHAGPEFKHIEKSDTFYEVDERRLDRIFEFNNFRAGPKVGCFYDSEKRPMAQGIWYYPSFINHSCWESNCLWNVYGGVMFIRACKDIKVGHELLTSYCKSICTTYSAKLNCFDWYGFNCDCTLCQLDKNDSILVHQKRDRLLEENTSVTSITSILSHIVKLKAVSGNRKHPLYLVELYNILGLAYTEDKKHRSAVVALTKCYELIEGTPAGGQIGLMSIWSIVQELLKIGDESSIKIAKAWIPRLKDLADIIFGFNSTYVLRATAPDFVRILKNSGIDF